jgi:POT family proton-dependent oligopeptide transporter
MGLVVSCIALGTIAFGNGLFKGNLQAIVGQMYDSPEYSGLRDSAYSIFYMGINIGAMFAPNAAVKIQTWWLQHNGFGNDASLPVLCNQFLEGKLADVSQFSQLASEVVGYPVSNWNLGEFATEYLKVFSTGYNYAFGIAAGAMLISLMSYIVFKRHLPERKKAEAGGAAEVPQMPKEEERQRIIALFLVFAVVIFFWMSFHQNGQTMTWFARDFTVKAIGRGENLVFNILSLLSIGLGVLGLVLAVKPSSTSKTRLIGGGMAVVFGALIYYFYNSFDASNSVNPVVFQQFNAFFVVFLTPVVVAAFAWLRSKGKEPSTPRKIGIGMVIAAIGFMILLIGSLNLPSPGSLSATGGVVSDSARVSGQWLVQTYLVLTFAELFLSPMGLSFVSKVAPPRFQGLMQGGWLCATAVGNLLVVVGALVWLSVPLWGVWAIFIVCCLVSATVMFSLLKRLERVAK